MLRPGVFLQDRYEIIEKIGSGGMSDVYKAKCHKLNRLVAIKVLKAEFSSDANFVSKFKMEAQAAAGLSHPNIVNVYDVVDEDDLHYIVMELIEGITLKSYINKKGRLDIKESIGISIQVAQGIAAAHEQHIIHRDIKPQNMIISKDGKVKVADFGIARAVSAQTLSSSAMGSVHYISPEQAKGGFSDGRSDIYSLGITMYEMVTGRVPFMGDNTVTIALAHLEEPITPPSVYNPEIPVSLEKIILKCTQKLPELRYSDVEDLISDLRHVLLNPDDDIITLDTVPDINSETKMISEEELNIIKSTSNVNSAVGTRKPSKNAKQHYDKIDDDAVDDVNPKLERLLAGIGVIVAIIIVAVLVVVFAKLGGLFSFGPGESSANVPDSTVESSESLNDTEVHMPNVLGLPQDLAETKLKESSLVMRVVGYDFSEEYEKGLIMSQENEEGSIVSKYSTVNVVMSNGSNKTDLAGFALVGLDVETAKNILAGKHFEVITIEEVNETIPKNQVISYSPEKAVEGDTIMLTVSSGPAVVMAAVPNITGQTEEIAIGMLADAGLVPGEVSQKNSETVPRGSILSQGIEANSQVESNTAVSYVVSAGPVPKTYKYIASIDTSYNIKDLIGPGSSSVDVELMIRLKQTVNGEVKYKTLMEPRSLNGDQILPVSFSKIEGAEGVDSGEVEVVNADTDEILKSYDVTFFKVE